MVRTLLLLLTLVAAPLYAEVKHIDNTELQGLLDAGVPIVDVRTAKEWRQTGVIAGSHQLTFFQEDGGFDAQTWLGELQKIVGPEQPVILICAVGGRTKAITQFLDQQVGYRKVHNVERGIVDWIKAGKAVTPVE